MIHVDEKAVTLQGHGAELLQDLSRIVENINYAFTQIGNKQMAERIIRNAVEIGLQRQKGNAHGK